MIFIWVQGESEAAPMPEPGPEGDMRSALKFLQNLDSYYGQIARPRYVDLEFKQK